MSTNGANFNYYLNRQGPQGVQGEKGDTGFSPSINIGSNTVNEFTLLITNEFNTIETPNLRGDQITLLGGTYVRYDAETNSLQAANPDYATDESYGEVILASDEDIELGAEDKVVTADRIYDLTEVINEQASTLTSLQTQIDEINNEIPDVNDGVLTFTQNGSTLGTFSANTADNVTINIPEGRLPNNGTLTIQRNGVNIGSFSADTSTNVTVNIPVPTDTGDLTNNAGYITAADVDLSDYVTNNSITTTLANYVKTADITTTLDSTSTNSQVPGAAAVQDYVTTQISSATADFITQSTLATEITNATQGFVDTETMSTAISEATSTQVTSETVRQIIALSQEEYDALETKNPETQYLIVGGEGVEPALTNLSNITDNGKAVVASLGMPSGTYTTLTVGVSESQYVAPTDGYFFAFTNPTNTGRVQIGLADASSGFGLWSWANSGEPMSVYIPARKGSSVSFRYINATEIIFRFYPVQGTESEIA